MGFIRAAVTNDSFAGKTQLYLLIASLFDKGEISNYRKFIAEDEDKVDLAVIRKQTRLGKPPGDRGFLEMFSKKLGYNLNFRSKGISKKGMCP